VNNFVEKTGLDIAQARRDAALDKMPKQRASAKLRKINDLHAYS